MLREKMINLRRIRGQSLLEYVLLTIAVAAALTAMTLYVQRSIQGNLKTIEDQVNAAPIKR